MAVVTGSFTSTGTSAPIDLSPFFTHLNGGLTFYNITVWGTFSATIRVERSFDGQTWHPLSKDLDGSEVSFTTPISIPMREAEPTVKYRLNCTTWGSGTANYRLSCR